MAAGVTAASRDGMVVKKQHMKIAFYQTWQLSWRAACGAVVEQTAAPACRTGALIFAWRGCRFIGIRAAW